MTEERILLTAHSLERMFSELRYSQPPGTDAGEQDRRLGVLQQGSQRVLLGALAYLQEHNAPVARALVMAGRAWAEQVLRGEEPRFVVKLSTKKPAPAWMMNPALIGAHRKVVEDLKAAWAVPVETPRLYDDRIVSHKGRYGKAQLEGTARRYERVRQRVAAVIKIHAGLAAEAGIHAPEVTERVARRWVTDDKSPARISYRILGAVLGKTPRLVKKMLDEAGRYMRRADEQHRLLDLWGVARVGAESVKGPAPASPSRLGRESES